MSETHGYSGKPLFQKLGLKPDMTCLPLKAPMDYETLVAGAEGVVSWPKKSSKLFRDLTEDDLRTVILPTGWVDVKVCAVDADWSGLKFLRHKA